MAHRPWTLLALIAIIGTLPASISSAADPKDSPIDFNRDIRPIISKKCFACHGPDAGHREAGLRLDQRTGAVKTLESGTAAISPGHADKSELIERLIAEDESIRMPPPESGDRLTAEQVALLKRWIDEGAAYALHWSFEKPTRWPLPKVSNKDWPKNGIDHFILARLEREKLTPTEPADRHALIRRLSLDLRGLPPTPDEVKTFVDDKSPDAYEKLVDRFLADPAFGERWARMWLDLARYADSMGYGSDPLRTIWRYRDWVIDAFNQNKPFDQFTLEQLAGDLLPNPTLEQKMATAFHRNTKTNTEGGTDDEEFRVEAVRDRVDTTVQVWMGLTMGCAKCHSHKYDPITQQEYYSFFAFFNQTADTDLPDESPKIAAPTHDMLEKTRRIDARLAELRKQQDTTTAALAAEQQKWEAGLKATSEWAVLQPTDARSEAGATLQTQKDGTIVVSGANPANDAYTVVARTSLKEITAFRLEALPDPAQTAENVGRAADGNFVLSRFSVAALAEKPGQPPSGRFVRVEIPGAQKMLSLAEAQVFSGGANVAPKGKARQSSTAFEGPAQLAIDGNTDGHYFNAKSTTHTAVETNPWWEVDLGADKPVEKIALWNRTDGALESRLSNFRLELLDAQRKTVWRQEVAAYPNPSAEFALSGDRPVVLSQATADFSQEAFPVANAIKQNDLTKSGWAVGPKQKEPHWAVFVAALPVGSDKGTDFSFRLEHRFKDPNFTLGRFRLSATTDPNITRQLAVPAEVLAIIATPPDKRTAPQSEQLARHYRSIAPLLKPVRDEIAQLEKERPVYPMIPVMQELPAEKRRVTHLMEKGNFLSPGETVQPGFPSAFPAPNAENPANRLGVARWLTDPNNPLTARVAVNRYWAQLFGIGLVETEEDFGTQGMLPTHPQLLDWLATEYVRLNWDTKALLRLIVTSAAYRQSSKVTADRLEKDPRNQLLSRGPRFRLEAEMVRDQALAFSGLLSRKMHGPSVFPPQPPNLWQAAFNGERTWATSAGEDKYRRGIYTFWRRTVPYPSMATFDAPSRELCSIRRIRTNTPLQAFVTLNDPVYVEAAQALARRIVREGGSNPEDRVRFSLELCLSRPAHADQVARLQALYDSELAHFRKNLKEAEQMASEPLGPLPKDADAAELAAWTVVANVLLNLDGVLTKG